MQRNRYAPAKCAALVLTLLVVASLCVSARAGEAARFIGNVVVEWLDDPFVPKMKLVADFGFADDSGKVWMARQGHEIDGRAFPPTARMIVGPPYAGEFRRSFVVYEYYVSVMTEPWQAVHRLLFNASRAEGMGDIEAKMLYAVAYAAGSRWETKASSRCFASCHAAAPSLTWRPGVTEADLKEWVEWTRRTDPTLDAIDEYLSSKIRRPGPHLFVQR